MFKINEEKIRMILKTEFQNKLLDSCLNNLYDENNKLRFNNFAYSIRELSRHILYSLSPTVDVINCSWYKNETDEPNTPSRSQRVKYAIQGGLSDHFVTQEIMEIDRINELKKRIKASMKILNNHTHINESTYNIENSEIDKLSKEVIEAFSTFSETINECKELIIRQIEYKISNEFVEHSIHTDISEYGYFTDFQEIEKIISNNYKVSKIESKSIQIEVKGTVHVELLRGTNKNLVNEICEEMPTSFSFYSLLNLELGATLLDSKVKIKEFTKIND